MVYGIYKDRELGDGIETRLKEAGAEKLLCEGNALKKKYKDGDTVVVSGLDVLSGNIVDAYRMLQQYLRSGVNVNVMDLAVFNKDEHDNEKLFLIESIINTESRMRSDQIKKGVKKRHDKLVQEGKLTEGFGPGPLKYSNEDYQQALALLKSGVSFEDIQERTGLSRSTLYRYMRKDKKNKEK